MGQIFDVAHIRQLLFLHEKDQLHLIVAEEDRKLQNHGVDKTNNVFRSSLGPQHGIFEKPDHDRHIFQHHLFVRQLRQFILENVLLHIEMLPWSIQLRL